MCLEKIKEYRRRAQENKKSNNPDLRDILFSRNYSLTPSLRREVIFTNDVVNEVNLILNGEPVRNLPNNKPTKRRVSFSRNTKSEKTPRVLKYILRTEPINEEILLQNQTAVLTQNIRFSNS